MLRDFTPHAAVNFTSNCFKFHIILFNNVVALSTVHFLQRVTLRGIMMPQMLSFAHSYIYPKGILLLPLYFQLGACMLIRTVAYIATVFNVQFLDIRWEYIWSILNSYCAWCLWVHCKHKTYPPFRAAHQRECLPVMQINIPFATHDLITCLFQCGVVTRNRAKNLITYCLYS